jgi:membrane dipeptidase
VIVDAHNDLLLELVVHRDAKPRYKLVLRSGSERLFEGYWLPRLEAGDVGLQICPLYGATAPPGEAHDWALAQVAEFRCAVEENAERVCAVGTRAELDDPRLRLVLSMEGAEPLEGDPGAFEEWYERGVRSMSLTWNHANEFAGGIDTPEQGLTDAGRSLVRRFAELGVVLDLAHASEQTWRDVVDPDAPTLSRWVDHVDHAVDVMGMEHVGLGADFIDQVPQQGDDIDASVKPSLGLEGFTAPDDYPTLVAALRVRGYDDDRLEAITSRNWLRVLRGVLPA